MNKSNIKLTFSYDGRVYAGWQKQKNIKNVQSTLEKVLAKFYQENIKTIGVGRTDAGAHAICYTANFLIRNNSIPVSKLTFVLNRSLPEDIRIINAEEVSIDFHSRFSALAREYVYLMVDSDGWLPFFNSYAYRYPGSVSIPKLREACALFCGEHDFRNFCFGYGDGMNYVREIFYFRVKRLNSDSLNRTVFFIKGNGFLRGMIRTIIAVCLNYAEGNIDLKAIEKTLSGEGKLESCYKAKVPASGLYFKRAYYY